MRAALYTRVSTRDKGQETANQLRELRDFCATQNWTIVHEYEDYDSGANSNRAQLKSMMLHATQRKFDVVVFWALDRFTREGTLATLKYLEGLESYGVCWRTFTEPWIDSAGPFRDVVVSLLASLAKQERVRIRERVLAGLRRVQETGTRSGRAVGRPKVVFRRDKVLELRKEGRSWRQIANETGASIGTVRRVVTGFQGENEGCQNPPPEAA